MTSGLRWRARFTAKEFKLRASRGAPEQTKRNETREGRGITWERRIRAKMTAGTVDPDEELQQPGGAISSEEEGGRRGDWGEFIGAYGN
jgi:hypothetical protein